MIPRLPGKRHVFNSKTAFQLRQEMTTAVFDIHEQRTGTEKIDYK